MWRGLAASAVASAAAAAPLASSIGSQPQECLGPTLWPARERGASRGPQMLTSGSACPPEPGQQSSRLLSHPAPLRLERATPQVPPCHTPSPPAHRLRAYGQGPGDRGRAAHPSGPPPRPPPPQEGQGDNRGHGLEVPEGHGAKHGIVITVTVRAHSGQKPALRLPGLPRLGPRPSGAGGSDLGGKQVGIWLAPKRPGNWTLGREDCSGLGVRAGGETERDSMCV